MERWTRPRVPWLWLPRLSTDGWLLFTAAGARNAAFGTLSVILGLYLSAVGSNDSVIGGIFTAALAGGALMTAVLTISADRLGRRRTLALAALLMAIAGATFAITTIPILLLSAAIVGTISPSGKEIGPLGAIEQAMLPDLTGAQHRTHVFAAYNMVGWFAGAFGALAAGLPTIVGLAPLPGYRVLLGGYTAAALLLLALYARLSPRVETPVRTAALSRRRLGLHRSGRVVAKLAALFAIDSFAGGFVVQSLVAYWFHLRYGVDTVTLGAIFFGTNLLGALSFIAAVPIARRIGLLRTMVFTHLPSNILLVLVPLMPSLPLAVAMLFARHVLSQMDVPTRQSYTMAIVDPDERPAAAGLTSVVRNTASAVAPAFTGAMLAVPTLGLPFLVAGGLKIVYDLAILTLFRQVRPPEEATLSARAHG